MTANCLPTFLGIGSMRCATSWLHRMLSLHPEIALPSPKQPNFFDKRILTRGLAWYRSQFRDGGERGRPLLRGEISTGYCKLGRRSVEMVRAILGDGPIIFSIREPIERTWSQLRYELAHRTDQPDEATPLVLARANARRVDRYNDYLRTLRIWASVFGRERIHVALYDDLVTDPAAYLRAVLEHIGVEHVDWRPPEDELRSRVLSTTPRPMPNALRWMLARRVRPTIEKMSEALDGRLNGWLERYDAIERPDFAKRAFHLTAWAAVNAGSTIAYESFEFARSVERVRRARGMSRTAAVHRPVRWAAALPAQPRTSADEPARRRAA